MGGNSQSTQGNSASPASASSAGSISGTMPFAPFLNSPIGQKLRGTSEPAPAPGFLGMIGQQRDYWKTRETNMTPDERRRQQAMQGFSQMAMQSPPPPQMAPMPKGPGGPSLLELVQTLNKSRM